MGLVLLLLLLALLLGGFGFALHVLWYVAIAVVVLAIISYFFKPVGGGRRWL